MIVARRTRAARRATVLLVCWLGLGACSDAARTVSLAELRETPERYAGSTVAVSGTLRSFDDPEHFWVENDALDRVGLEGGENLRALVGWTVEVRGTFRYDRSAGRRIEVTAIASAR